MTDSPEEQIKRSVQSTYTNTLKFEPGQNVYMYIGEAVHTFKDVQTLKVNLVHSLVTIATPNRIAVFRNWDGIEVGTGQVTDFVVGPMT